MENNSPKLNEKLKSIKLIVSDVDGVLTDGRIFFDSQGGEMKVFHARDAFRIEVWLRSGGKMLWFTGRKSEGLIRRAKELGVDLAFKSELQSGLFDFVHNKYQVRPEQVLYVGDDWSDLYYMERVGVSVAPANAATENRSIASIITTVNGGEGVLAEVVEAVMRAQDTWEQEVSEYAKKFIL